MTVNPPAPPPPSPVPPPEPSCVSSEHAGKANIIPINPANNHRALFMSTIEHGALDDGSEPHCFQGAKSCSNRPVHSR